MILHPRITGVVLAGGRAKRMDGANKALLPLGSDPLVTPLSRIMDVFDGRFADCLLLATDPAPYAALEVKVIPDRIPGCGPLGGIHAALRAVQTPYAFICACDMPFLSGPLLDSMALRARDERLLVPVHRGRPEPLHAIYPVSCMPEVERALGEGIRMLLDFLARVPVDYLLEQEFSWIRGAARSFDNINTPSDLESARG